VLYGWSVVQSFERTRGQDSSELLPVLVAVPVIHTKWGSSLPHTQNGDDRSAATSKESQVKVHR